MAEKKKGPKLPDVAALFGGTVGGNAGKAMRYANPSSHQEPLGGSGAGAGGKALHAAQQMVMRTDAAGNPVDDQGNPLDMRPMPAVIRTSPSGQEQNYYGEPIDNRAEMLAAPPSAFYSPAQDFAASQAVGARPQYPSQSFPQPQFPPAPAAPPQIERAPMSVEQATLDQIDRSVRQAKLRGAGSPLPPASYTYGMQPPAQDAVAVTRAANQTMPERSAYDPSGIQGRPSTRTGQAAAIKTGDPFFDQNIDFDRLAKEKLVRDNNDAAFAQQNSARLADIAADRERATAARASKLGLLNPNTDIQMNPHRYTRAEGGLALTPEELQARDQNAARNSAENMGRANLHAIAQKFVRNGVPPALAYTYAANTMRTTNDNDPSSFGTPSLPGVDPMRAVTMAADPRTGQNIGQTTVGTGRNDVMQQGQQLQYGAAMDANNVQRERTQADLLRSWLESSMASQQGQGEWGFKREELEAQRQAAARAQLTAMMTENGGAAFYALPPQMQQMLTQQAMGQPQGQPPAPPSPPQGAPQGQQTIMPGNQGAQPFTPPDLNSLRSNNPAMMGQHLGQVTESQQPRELAMTHIRGGNPNDPAVSQYIHGLLEQEDPNFFWGPDWNRSFWNRATGLGPSRHDAAAEWLNSRYGIPVNVGSDHAKNYYGG